MIPRIHILVSILAGFFMVAASAGGVFLKGAYSKEAALWAAQGIGQDYVNLFIVFPILLVLSHFVFKGSRRALLVWLGLLMYMTYSYMLYSFFVSFDVLFPVYVAALGFSFYALFGSIFHLLKSGFVIGSASRPAKAASIYLVANGTLFTLLWLSDIASSLMKGTIPISASELGFAVNPVQVLDLAFILPAMIITGLLLYKKRDNGYLFSIPLVTFAIAMSSAIIGMIVSMYVRELPISFIPAILMFINVIIGSLVGVSFLRSINHGKTNI